MFVELSARAQGFFDFSLRTNVRLNVIFFFDRRLNVINKGLMSPFQTNFVTTKIKNLLLQRWSLLKNTLEQRLTFLRKRSSESPHKEGKTRLGLIIKEDALHIHIASISGSCVLLPLHPHELLQLHSVCFFVRLVAQNTTKQLATENNHF